MDLNLLLGNLPENSIEREAVLRMAKELLPHVMYDKIPIQYDDKNNIKNKELASSIWGWQRDVIYNLKPNDTPIVISHLTNGSGKTFTITLSLALLLIDDHPSLSPGFMGVKGEFWLLTNPSLLKTEYPKAFLRNPGFLGKEDDYKKNGYYDIVNSRGETHTLKIIKNSTGDLEGFVNTTNGKSIRFWSYSVNEQKLAGHNPLSIFCDEFGDKTTTSGASGANRLTWGKFEEMIVRCGRNHLAGNNWVFCLFFTLTLGESWIEDMIDLAKDGRAIIPRLNKLRDLPEDHQCVHLVKGTATTENPYINKSTIEIALGLGELLGRTESLARRLISTDNDDPNLVFPRSCRPKKLDVLTVKELIRSAQTEPGWMLVESIDPGWSDKCSVLMTLVHPIKGIHIIDEFYGSGYTVNQVAAVVKEKERLTFESIKVSLRLYDPHHIKKTTQESPVPNYRRWKDAGLPGQSAYWSRDRSYDQMFELVLRDLIHYYPTNCVGLDREVRVHRRDQHGIPEEKANNHSIDALRHICNWYHEVYAKKIHLTRPIDKEELSEARKAYLAQVEYYNNFIKLEPKKESTQSKLMGVSIKGINTRNIRGL